MSQLEIDLERRTLTVRSEEAAPRTLPLPPELMGELAGIENITRIAASSTSRGCG